MREVPQGSTPEFALAEQAWIEYFGAASEAFARYHHGIAAI
ncbi:MAG TPA: hypothetical protein VK569_08610 [Bacteroidota bacterium]|nr:hypothetical protein [Bacteroidota bacterium]